MEIEAAVGTGGASAVGPAKCAAADRVAAMATHGVTSAVGLGTGTVVDRENDQSGTAGCGAARAPGAAVAPGVVAVVGAAVATRCGAAVTGHGNKGKNSTAWQQLNVLAIELSKAHRVRHQFLQ